MANTNLGKTRPRCFIVYGWSEGPWQSRKMRHLLEERGFEVTEQAVDADVIIAHSLGCYLVPPSAKDKLIILIGLPYWPGRPVIVSIFLNALENLKSSWRDGSWWLNKLAHNLWYILVKPSSTYYAVTRRHLSYLPRAHASQRVVLVRNADDIFCHPDIAQMLPDKLDYEYIDMPEKLHEDCWLNPTPYIKLAEKYYG